MICTPSCSICLKNYSKDCKPVILQPCGHGGCSTCIDTLQSREQDAKCPICRATIQASPPNYDLREITSNVERQHTYWGRRLMEIVDLPGNAIEISPSIEPFCKIICYRLSLDIMLKEIKDTMTSEQKIEIYRFKEIWKRAMIKSNICIEDAMSWLKVFELPYCVHQNMIEFVLEFYEKKYFLEKHNAMWIMDAIRV